MSSEKQGLKVHGVVDGVLNLLFPTICTSCGKNRATSSDGYVCDSCKNNPKIVRWLRNPFCEKCGLPFRGDISQTFTCSNCTEVVLYFDFARSAVEATDGMFQLVHGFKYEKKLWLVPFFVELLRESMGREENPADAWDWIVPVPLHPVKRREREFNQSEELARALQKVIKIPMNNRLLSRVEYTQTQTRLSRRERAINMKEAFRLSDTSDLQGKNILILDDVLTTGATTSACARILRKAGCSRIGVWTVVRGV